VRVVALADSDSYVKWGAALLGALPAGDERLLLVVRTPLVVSDAQLDSAVAGGESARVERVDLPALAARLARERPDAVLVATTGPIARVLIRVVAALEPRPVVVTGLPGISIPATRKAVRFRRQADLLVLHSRREVADFGVLARELDGPRPVLATLPFAERGAATGTDLVFAAQAIVPAARVDRLVVARILRDAALADPTRRVVVKVRAVAGETQTHAERDGYPDLLATLGPLPENLVVSAVSMARALDTAEGLVTVSSTAAIEALARRIPVIVLDTFGVAPELINPVFVDSGLFGGAEAVLSRAFRHPEPGWLADNYFHDAVDDDWREVLGDLVEARRRGALAERPVAASIGGRVRMAWDRKRAFGAADRTPGGYAALVVGMPARSVARLSRAARARLSARRRTPI